MERAEFGEGKTHDFLYRTRCGPDELFQNRCLGWIAFTFFNKLLRFYFIQFSLWKALSHCGAPYTKVYSLSWMEQPTKVVF